MYYVDEPRFLLSSQNIWNDLRGDEELRNCFATLLQAIRGVDIFRDTQLSLGATRTIYDWIFSLLIQLPDIDDITDAELWELDQLINRYGKKGIEWTVEAISSRLAIKQSLQSATSTTFRTLPYRTRLTKFSRVISEDGNITPQEESAVDLMLRLYEEEPEVSYAMLEYLTDFDLHGRVVPDILVKRIEKQQVPDREKIGSWARFAGHYGFNSRAWRKISLAACHALREAPSSEIERLYVALSPRGMRSSQFNAGEMNPEYYNYLEVCRSEMEREIHPELKPFRVWRFNDAQYRYDRALAEFREKNDS